MRSADQNREITLTADEADELLVILNNVVVSLDRMGSREAAGEDPGHTWIHEYFGTGGATRRLSHARRILLEAFDRVYTEEEQGGDVGRARVARLESEPHQRSMIG